MTRDYDPDRPVPRETVEKCLDLAVRAPSAGHTQGREFLVLNDITSRDNFWSTAASGPPDRWLTGMRSAPVLVLCLADREAYVHRYAEPDKNVDAGAWPIPYWDVDTGMAVMVLLLAAENAGLGACFFGLPPERRNAVFAAFDIPDSLRAVGVVSLGYPSASGDRRSRSLRRGHRSLAEQTHWGSFRA